MKKILHKHPLLLYFCLAYLISWACWLPLRSHDSRLLLIAGSFGPAASALLLTCLLEGKKGIAQIARRVVNGRVHFRWYLFSLFSTVIAVFPSIYLCIWLAAVSPRFNDLQQAYLIPLIFIYVLLFSVLGEEIGWRGFALPRLLSNHSPLMSSVILGTLWSFWHLPLFWAKNNFHQVIPFCLFFVQSIALTIVFTWLYRHTGGSLLIALLFHAASNTTIGILPVLPMDTGGDMRPLWLTVFVLTIFAIFLVAVEGKVWLKKGRVISSSEDTYQLPA